MTSAEVQPVLCTGACTAALPAGQGTAISRGEKRFVCKICETGGACHSEQGRWVCDAYPNVHEVEERMICRTCGATDKSKSVILTFCAVLYSDPVECMCRSLSCSPHRFRANKCGHVMCDVCFKRAFTSILATVQNMPDGIAKTNEVRELALTFVADREGYLVPPCPLCSEQLLPKAECGCFTLQAMRILPKATFSAAKMVANEAFFASQQGY
jgi:hypothetical protein